MNKHQIIRWGGFALLQAAGVPLWITGQQNITDLISTLLLLFSGLTWVYLSSPKRSLLFDGTVALESSDDKGFSPNYTHPHRKDCACSYREYKANVGFLEDRYICSVIALGEAVRHANAQVESGLLNEVIVAQLKGACGDLKHLATPYEPEKDLTYSPYSIDESQIVDFTNAIDSVTALIVSANLDYLTDEYLNATAAAISYLAQIAKTERVRTDTRTMTLALTRSSVPQDFLEKLNMDKQLELATA